LTALLDCAKAFDRMHRGVLLEKLWSTGIRGKLFELVISYYYRRRQRVKLGKSTSDFCKTNLGGPQGSVITVISWLIYINDITLAMNESECGLFVDDVCAWIADPDPSKCIKRLNADLDRIYNWSVCNTMVFDSQKFHLLDIGKPNIGKFKKLAEFNGTSPTWCSEAKYLGIIIDNKLTFTPMLNYVTEKVSRSLWRLFNHTNHVTGASVRSLKLIFSAWIMPHFIYGSPIWIFLMYDNFHYSSPLRPQYKKCFENLEKIYNKCCRNILGLPPGTSNLAVLVRLGIMPLNYLLAYRACTWYLRIVKGLAGSEVHDQLWNLYSDDEAWTQTCFFRPAYELIKRLNLYVKDAHKIDIFTAPFHVGRRLLKEAFFHELNTLWNDYDGCKIGHIIHPEWKPLKWQNLMTCKRVNVQYHRLAVGRGNTQVWYDRIGISVNKNCRFCKNTEENIEHLFLHCQCLTTDRVLLKSKCEAHNITFDLQTLFTHPKLQIPVEKFIAKHIT